LLKLSCNKWQSDISILGRMRRDSSPTPLHGESPLHAKKKKRIERELSFAKSPNELQAKIATFNAVQEKAIYADGVLQASDGSV
jgi:hypothetical protein